MWWIDRFVCLRFETKESRWGKVILLIQSYDEEGKMREKYRCERLRFRGIGTDSNFENIEKWIKMKRLVWWDFKMISLGNESDPLISGYDHKYIDKRK